jgi:diphthine synthase
MVLYMIGLGLGDEDDITVKGLKIVQSCSHVFLEAYTSVLGVDKARLEEVYGKSITIADRDMVEQHAEDLMLDPAVEGKVALLVVGDPVCATTHTDLVLRARQRGIPVQVIHNASIMGAAGACGLQLYTFGQTVSLPFFEVSWRPTSFYPKIRYNRRGGLHTLCLLDIKVKEPDFDAMMQGKTRYLPPRFMTIAQAAAQLLEAEEEVHKEGVYDGTKTLCVGLARMGQESQRIVAGTLMELQAVDFGGPLHSLIICGELHELELEVLQEYLVENSTYELETLVAAVVPEMEPEEDENADAES